MILDPALRFSAGESVMVVLSRDLLLATAGPARRGLRVDPIEELRQG